MLCLQWLIACVCEATKALLVAGPLGTADVPTVLLALPSAPCWDISACMQLRSMRAARDGAGACHAPGGVPMGSMCLLKSRRLFWGREM